MLNEEVNSVRYLRAVFFIKFDNYVYLCYNNRDTWRKPIIYAVRERIGEK